jgi:Uma2 family endonuclease
MHAMLKVMGVRTAIPIDQYLHTSFPDLDQEYRDGALVERTLPDYLHGKAQGLLVAFFVILRKTLSVFPCVETRMRLRPNVVLIPDVAVFYPTEPARMPESPPLIVIEVLSLDDRLPAVREKLEEYRVWGVPHVWLVDPHSRRLYIWDSGLKEVDSLKIPDLGIEVLPRDVFDWN